MALRSTEQKPRKSRFESTQDVEGRTSALRASPLSGSELSIDSGLDGVKVTEMLNGITGGHESLEKHNQRSVDVPVTNGPISSIERSRVATQTKASRKRAALIRKKVEKNAISIAIPTEEQKSVVAISPLTKVTLPDISTDFHVDTPRNESLPITDTVPSQTTHKEKTKKKKKKISKVPEETKSSKMNSEAGQPEVDGQHVQTVAQVESPDVTSAEKKDSKKNKKKNATMDRGKPAKPAQTVPAVPVVPVVSVPEPTSDSIPQQLAVSQIKKQHKKQKSIMQKSVESLATTSAGALSDQQHTRQHSYDVRVRLNGKQQKLVTIESPVSSASNLEREIADKPLKIKLPGKAVILAWPEDSKNTFPRHTRINSHATSVSSQHSRMSSRGGIEMRSRQSSHTTVGNNDALESKLQNMILSHSRATPAEELSLSAQGSSELEPQEDKHLTSHSAPPIASPMFKNVAGELNADITKDDIGYTGQQVPAVPTLYDLRSSQVQAPPSLGPAQPQNLPEQMPHPYQGSTHGYLPNQSFGYAPQYVPAQTYYNYPHTAYAPVPFGMQAPFYDYPLHETGTVYFNPDGSQVYPQQYYGQPVMYSNPYSQQHYEY